MTGARGVGARHVTVACCQLAPVFGDVWRRHTACWSPAGSAEDGGAGTLHNSAVLVDGSGALAPKT